MGFAGVQNFPTVGLIDGVFRQNLEETGMGYGLEVDMIRGAPQARPADHALRLSATTPSPWPRPGPTSSSATWA
jgi:predicted TIM-barrel enzyme